DLWRYRFDAARRAALGASYVSELAAFGWWLGSGKFDAIWAVTQLIAVLTLNNGTIESKHLVMESLADYASAMPLITVECLDLLIEGNEEGRNILNWQEHARNILMAAYNSTDDTARKIAKDLVNRLGARGYYEAFRDLAFRT
ncbi:MAG TPA: hypothetical protein VK140_00720, partial [Ktedonobacteraceae bacterium]|nr:hypothetical protein [Ktedonobacteraceae bacterium]